MSPEKIGHRWIFILLLSLIMAGCSSLDRFLDTGSFDGPPEDTPRASGKRIPLPPTIQDLESGKPHQ